MNTVITIVLSVVCAGMLLAILSLRAEREDLWNLVDDIENR